MLQQHNSHKPQAASLTAGPGQCRINLEMIKGLTESGTSLFELVKMQKEYVDLLEKRIEILENFVFKDVRKD